MLDNVATNNTGWGVRLNGCSGGIITGNNVSWNDRANLGDSAGLLVVNKERV